MAKRTKRLTLKRAAHLSEIIAPHELYLPGISTDARAAALIELVEGMASERDATEREMIALEVSTVAYRNADVFGSVLDDFVKGARTGAVDRMLKGN